MDKLQYYKIWKSIQTNIEFINSTTIPLVFPKEYLTIKRNEIKLTEDKKVMDKLFSLADNINKVDEVYTNIYLHSKKCGNGKTMWATIIAHKYVYLTGKRAYFVKDEDLHKLAIQLNSFNNYDAVETLNKMLEVPLLVIDDLGTLELNRTSSSLFHKLIDTRFIKKNPTIYTSNLNESGLITQLSIKLASRIWNTSYILELTAPDLRKLIMEKNNIFE